MMRNMKLSTFSINCNLLTILKAHLGRKIPNLSFVCLASLQQLSVQGEWKKPSTQYNTISLLTFPKLGFSMLIYNHQKNLITVLKKLKIILRWSKINIILNITYITQVRVWMHKVPYGHDVWKDPGSYCSCCPRLTYSMRLLREKKMMSA